MHEAEEPEAPTNVVSLMDALRDSLGGRGRRTARNGGGKEGKVVQFRRSAAGKTKARPHGTPTRRGTARPARQRKARPLS